MGGWNLDNVSRAFSDAAVDPSLWDRAMDVVAAETGSFGAALFPIRGRCPRIPFTRSLGEAFEKYLSEGWVHRDERYRAVPWIERRGVSTDADFMSEEGMRRHPYYQEFLAPFGLKWAACVGMATDGELFWLSLQRTANTGPYARHEQRKLAALSQSLSAAAAVARMLGFARAEGALDAFATSGIAAALLDIDGTVVRINAAAERLIDREIRVVRRRFVSADRAATVSLDAALHRLLWTRVDSALMPPVPLPRAGRRPVLAYPMRLEKMSAGILGPCHAILVLIDTERSNTPPHETLRSLFGLTAAEANIASRLAAGEALADVADDLGIAKETARTQLKGIFQKVGVGRQAELVALLARLTFSRV